MIGVPSNGLHTNGYSLVRKFFFEIKKYKKVQSKTGANNNSNECVFEWIRNNAKSFCDKWPNS